MQSIFEKMGGKYIKVGDYYVPDFGQFDEEPTENRPLGKYGMLRRTFLEEHRKPLYNHLVLSGELHSHLHDIDELAQNLLDTVMPKMKQNQGVTEELRSTNQMEWVGRMNNIVAQLEEIIFCEIVYS